MSVTSSPSKPARRPLPLWWRVIRVPLVAYLLILLMLSYWENSLIYFPAKHPQGDWTLPIATEEAHFSSADGTKLHGWYASADEPVAVILFCHGNAGNVTHRADVMRAVQNMNASIFVFDYRGYGRSEGVPNEAGVLADARAARAWLAMRTGVAEKDIVLMGESLGGGVAVDLAARDGARALVLEDTFTSLPDMAAHHYSWLPVRWLMRGKLDSLANIGKYQGPLLMAHGTADSIVPFSYAQKLFDAANEPKQLVAEDGADHNDPHSSEFLRELRQFLHGLPPLKE